MEFTMNMTAEDFREYPDTSYSKFCDLEDAVKYNEELERVGSLSLTPYNPDDNVYYDSERECYKLY